MTLELTEGWSKHKPGICCTLRGDFIEGMQKVLKDVRERGSHLDGVLIETTGLADPSPIASTFFLDPFMQENYRLDSILGVCDTKHLMSQLSEVRAKSCVNEASEQVAFSDRLLLTKTDLCTDTEIQGVVQHLRHLNPFAKVIPLNLKDLERPIPVDQLCDWAHLCDSATMLLILLGTRRSVLSRKLKALSDCQGRSIMQDSRLGTISVGFVLVWNQRISNPL